MCELLGQGIGVVADAEDVLLDGRGLGLEGHQLIGDRGIDFDDALIPLAHGRQLLVHVLKDLVHGLPVGLKVTHMVDINK